MNCRLGIVLSHPVQYYSPWFRWISTHTTVTLRVFYLSDAGIRQSHDPQFGKSFSWDVDLLSGYEYEFVENTSEKPGTDHFFGLKNPTLFQRVREWEPDVVLIFGYNYFSHLSFILRALLRGTPLLFRGDSHLLGRGSLPFWKQVPLTLLYHGFAAILCTGAANRDYYMSLHVSVRRLFMAPHCVDSAHFKRNERDQEKAQNLRDTLGLTKQTRVLLFAGKLVPAKQPYELLQAFIEMQPTDTALVFVGDGEEKSRMQSAVHDAKPGTVHFLPFANQSEMPSRYLLADVFILPSRGFYETWGLAVNEAMHMGVPCLVSNRVGCQQDLVEEGKTGWVFDVDKPAGLREAINRALSTDRTAMRTRVLERISQFTYEQATQGLLSALAAIRKGKPPQP